MSARKKIVSQFVRNQSGRHSVGAMGDSPFSHESRYAKARSSHQGFSQKAKTEQVEIVTTYKSKKKNTELIFDKMPVECFTKSYLEAREQVAYRCMEIAIEKLGYLRVAYDRLTKAELDAEVRLLYEKLILQIVAYYLGLDEKSLLPSLPKNNAIYLKDMTFAIQKYTGLTCNFEEHFLCVIIYRLDVRFTSLVTLTTNHVAFPEFFRYEIPDQDFHIEVILYSILDKERPSVRKPKRFFNKLFGASPQAATSGFEYDRRILITNKHRQRDEPVIFETRDSDSRVGRVEFIQLFGTPPNKAVTSGFEYHGRILITNKHRQRDEPVIFETRDPDSRVGATSVKFSFTNRQKNTEDVDFTVKNRQMA